MIMKTKIVYVLSSDDRDFYLEQTLISVYSLRMYNKDVYVVLLTDKETNAGFVGTRYKITDYFNEIVVVDTPEGYDNARKSRYLKTLIRQKICGDFLYVDSDTIITGSIKELDCFSIEIGGIPDKHVLLAEHPLKDIISRQLKVVGLEIEKDKPYINGGVFYAKDVPIAHRLFELWHSKWLEVQHVQKLDQPPLAWANKKLDYPILLIDDRWNCQVIDNGLRFLNKAKIIHYFASSKSSDGKAPYALYDNRIYRQLRNNGKIPKDVIDMLSDPYSAFIPVCRIVSGDDLKILDSDWYRVVYKEFPSLFKLTESVSLLLSRILKIILKLCRINHN